MAIGASGVVAESLPINIATLLKTSVANVALQRPDWTETSGRETHQLWLDKNENSDPLLSQIIMEVYRSVDEQALYGYPGTSTLYEKLADYLGVTAKNLLLSHGSDGVIRSMFEMFINVGDKVLVTSPTFVMYEVYAHIYGANLFKVDYYPSSNGPVLETKRLLDAIHQYRPKLVCLPNPGSPTGTIFPEEDLKEIVAFCSNQGTVALIDEAYHPFCKVTALPWINEYSTLVVSRTFSKAWGLAGLRIGYAVGSNEVISYLHKVRPMYEVNSVAVAVVEKMLEKTNEVMSSVCRLQSGMNYFLGEIKGMGFKVVEGAGNFSHVYFDKRLEYFHERLHKDVLYKKSFDHPSLFGFSRFSSAPKEEMKKVIELIR